MANSTADNRARIFHEFTVTATGATFALILKGCNVDQRNFFDISVQLAGTGAGIITLERKRPTDSAWRIIETYTADTEKIGEMHGNWEVRLNVSTHSSAGTITCELAQA